jgi:hypothetical protein
LSEWKSITAAAKRNENPVRFGAALYPSATASARRDNVALVFNALSNTP